MPQLLITAICRASEWWILVGCSTVWTEQALLHDGAELPAGAKCGGGCLSKLWCQQYVFWPCVLFEALVRFLRLGQECVGSCVVLAFGYVCMYVVWGSCLWRGWCTGAHAYRLVSGMHGDVQRLFCARRNQHVPYMWMASATHQQAIAIARAHLCTRGCSGLQICFRGALLGVWGPAEGFADA